MSFTPIRPAAGLALLAALAAGCGTAAAAHHPASQHMSRQHRSAPMHAAAHPATHAVNPIPQGNGGDHDGDNTGGPSDGDGNL